LFSSLKTESNDGLCSLAGTKLLLETLADVYGSRLTQKRVKLKLQTTGYDRF